MPHVGGFLRRFLHHFSDLRHVGGYIRFPSTIKLTYTMKLEYF
jgi:hypothetical protein